MIDKASCDAVEAARWGEHWVKPLYGSYCFAEIPGLVRSLFGAAPCGEAATRLLGPLARPYRHVVLCMIDAFGWRFFEQYRSRYPFLERFVEAGHVTKLTSQFPSTTAAHVTALHTGLPVGQSGIFEWFYYEPRVDAVIAPLLFSFAGDRARGTLRSAAIDPRDIYPTTTYYHDLATLGVESHIFQHRDYTPSPYGSVVCAGAHEHPFSSVREGITLMTEMLGRETAEHAYYYFYCGTIDVAGHRHGVDSPQFAAEVNATFKSLESIFHAQSSYHLHDTLLLLTADHGQINGEPESAIYLNLALPESVDWMRVGARQTPLAPAGSCRDMFLYIRPEFEDVAENRLRDFLAGRAEVHRTTDLIAQGFFGPEPLSAEFHGRMADLVVLPNAGETVWWYEQGRFAQDKRGHHGGLTPQEMETQLLALAYV